MVWNRVLNNLGTFDPLKILKDFPNYCYINEVGTCIDTAVVNVVDTEVQIDSITFVLTMPVDLDMVTF